MKQWTTAKPLSFCQKHLYTFWLLLWIFCTIGGLFLWLIIANADDAPGAIFIFGGIALLGSGLICGIGIGLTKTLLEIKEQLEK